MAKKKISVESTVRDIRRKTRKKYSAEEKIRIVLEGLRGESTVAELCRREGIAQSLYYKWSKEFIPKDIGTMWRPGSSGCQGTQNAKRTANKSMG